MEQPDHDLRPFQNAAATPNRIFALVVVAVIHVAFVWALANGLARQFVKPLEEFKAEVVKEPPPKEEKAPPPPPPDLVKPPPPFVPPPDFTIANDAPATNAITAVQGKHEVPPPPPPKPVARAEPPTPIAGSHSQPEYPSISRRLGEQGTVTLKLSINAEGDVTDAQVEESSGYNRLDEAAADYVKRRWRYHPATGEGGKPIASTISVRVKFDLRS